MKPFADQTNLRSNIEKGFRVKYLGQDSGSGFGVWIQGQDSGTGSGFRVKI
jgi:hypothetical protein